MTGGYYWWLNITYKLRGSVDLVLQEVTREGMMEVLTRLPLGCLYRQANCIPVQHSCSRIRLASLHLWTTGGCIGIYRGSSLNG